MPPYNSTLEEIKDRIDILDFISNYVHLKKAGQNWKGLCPFHSEKTPSFMVSPAKQIFHCFGCGSGGDIFTFLMRHENLSFPEAMRFLSKRAGVTLKESAGYSSSSGEKEILLSIHKEALAFFQSQLKLSGRAMTYLNGRNIDSQTQELFSLGYAPKSWNGLLSYLGRKGYKADMIRKSGLVMKGTRGDYDTFRDRIIFPMHDLTGDIIAFGGRSIERSDPKYLNSPETRIFNKRRILFGLFHARNDIKKAGYALLMEGYLDVITAHRYGFSHSVAPLGTACTNEHGKLLKRFTDNVVIVFDNDQAGIKAAKNAAGILLENGINVKILSMPENADPDSFLREKGKESFQKSLDHSLSIIEFFLQQKRDKHLIAREILETISRISNNVLQGEYLKSLSDRLGIEERFIIEEFQKVHKGLRNGSGESFVVNQGTLHQRPLYEVYIIQLLLQSQDKARKVSESLLPDDFRDPVTKAILMKIKEGATDLNTLLSRCKGREKDFLTEISLHDSFDNPDKILNDCIKQMKENRQKQMLQDLQDRIREAESKNDFDLLKKLQREHQLIRSRND